MEIEMPGLEVIEEHLVKQYSQNVLYLASQEMSMLRGTVLNESVQGEEKFWDQYGTLEMLERTQRFGDSPINITPRESRRLTLFAFETGEPVDSFDTIRMLNDPTSPLVRRHSEAAARQFDRTIIQAGLGTAVVGRKTPTNVPLPAEQVVDVDNHDFDAGAGDVGLTVGKLIAAKNIFGNADVYADNFHIVCTQNQISDLLTQEQITSIDYNNVKALVNGDVNTFMGFTFHRVTPGLLPLNADGDRRVLAYDPQGIVLGIGEDVQAFIDRRADKSFNWYVYMSLFIGATRTEEARVVEIECAEPGA
jgi:hypothetical protein